MSDLNIIIICLVLVGCALFGVSVINAQQVRKRLISQKVMQLKRKITEMEDVAAALENLTGNTATARILNEEIIDTLSGMLQLQPNSPSLELVMDATRQRIEEISSPGYSCNIHRMLDSDAAIAHAQYLLGEAARIIRKRQAQGQIELTQMTSHIEELSWAHLMVSVISLTGQGHKALQRGDPLRAHAFYKKAQESAMESVLSDDRRHQWIRELGELMSGKRKTISRSLMPESMYNPDENQSVIEAPKDQPSKPENTPLS